jgi:hypothetical protein
MSVLGQVIVLLMGTVIVVATVTIVVDYWHAFLERLRPRYRTAELLLLRGTLWRMPRRNLCQV